MNKQTDFVIVSTTIGKDEQAESLAAKMIESKHAACVQCTLVKSTYRWEGKVEQAQECLLMAKTRIDHVDQLMSLIKKEHKYEMPEIIVTPIIAGDERYLSWIESELA